MATETESIIIELRDSTPLIRAALSRVDGGAGRLVLRAAEGRRWVSWISDMPATEATRLQLRREIAAAIEAVRS